MPQRVILSNYPHHILIRIPIIIQSTFTAEAGTIQQLLISIIRRCVMGVSVAERMPLEKAVELLKEDGIEVTGEEASVILAFYMK
ncbi:MAG: hypothetical protein WKG06_20815 [Segetibacter sp.]